MNEEFDIKEIQTTFDFKGFLFKLLRYWPLFLISMIIAFGVAYYINVRKLPVYYMENMITIKDDQNPFFTSNTSLTFNWGGTTDKVNTALITLKSRSHNENVVETLQYYVNYYRDGEYQKVDAYKQTPYFVEVDTTKYQVLGKEMTIIFKDSLTFSLNTKFEDGNQTLQNYGDKEKISKFINGQDFSREYKLGQKIELPFFHATLLPNPEVGVVPQKPSYISLSEFDGAVRSYMGVNISPESTGSSVLRLSMTGQNKSRLVDYLNTTVDVLSRDALERKNLFATKTIRFIDSSLQKKSAELLEVEDELNSFKNQNSIFDLESEGSDISTRLNALDLRKESIKQELNYYNVLENYLVSRSNYTNVPAPSVAGIQEASIIQGVSSILSLAEERSKLQYSFKEGAPVFADIDRRINALKSVLLENINSSKGLKQQELNSINRDIGGLESEIKKLPKEQQGLLKIERRLTLSEGGYNLFLEKRGEAGLVKAANVSDVLMIDPAKDTGGGQIGPNTRLNYIMALFFGFIIPFVFVFLKVFSDTKISGLKDVERLTKIPILGVIGESAVESNLTVIEKPKSAVAESFRALRSSLQFMYKKQGITGSKTVMITSSVSGEGKTFTSINIASVFALSERKTVLIGLDLRKPKIFGDFDIDNKIGITNYLIEEATIEDIVQNTQLPFLDIITSGPVPPNPSELLMGDRMDELIETLKQTYDYIILDTPPIGLVADSFSLLKYADASLYIVRQNYTQQGMFSLINDKYKKGEIKNLSIVLNFFKDKTARGYGYGSNYGYGYGAYGNGYHEDEENVGIIARVKKLLRFGK